MKRISPILALATAALMAFAGPALAHAHYVSSVPGADAPATPATSEIRIQFTENIDLAFSKVEVTPTGPVGTSEPSAASGEASAPSLEPTGAAVETGELALDPADAKTLIVPLVAPLAEGHYTVTWSVVADDGHKSSGSFGFDSTGSASSAQQ